MRRVLIIVGSLAAAVGGNYAAAVEIGDVLLGPDTASVNTFLFDLDEDGLSGLGEGASLGSLLDDADAQISGVSGGLPSGCAGIADSARLRACFFVDNLRRYRSYIDDDTNCRIDGDLGSVENTTTTAASVVADLEASRVTGSRQFTSQNLFQVSNTPDANDSTYPVFGFGEIRSDCQGLEPLRVTPVRVPSASTAKTDKLILAYAMLMSEKTWEYNRLYALATAERIQAANVRWSNFEVNVIHDQYPWETLLFNNWLARSSKKFRGTLTHPPTRQLRALHPVPTAILDVDGEETLFRPRLSVEVLGIRYLNDGSYTPKRAYSIITTLKAEDDEGFGWGLLYTWKRGSVGIIHQEKGDDDVIGLVFGIDLANQIDSKRNDLMEKYQKLRDDIEQRLP